MIEGLSKRSVSLAAWDNANVFDVYSLSTGTGLDGTAYSTWGCEGMNIGSIPGNILVR